jgi:hypothetical protein
MQKYSRRKRTRKYRKRRNKKQSKRNIGGMVTENMYWPYRITKDEAVQINPYFASSLYSTAKKAKEFDNFEMVNKINNFFREKENNFTISEYTDLFEEEAEPLDFDSEPELLVASDYDKPATLNPAKNPLSMKFMAHRAGPSTVTKTAVAVRKQDPYSRALKHFARENGKEVEKLTEEERKIVREMVANKQHADLKRKIMSGNKKK